MDAPFEYSPQFRSLIENLHRGKETWPQYKGYVNAHLSGPDSRLFEIKSTLIREIEWRCGSLVEKRVLDIGCGTGATTAALAEISKDIVAFDVDEESVTIAKERLREHGRSDQVKFLSGIGIEAIADSLGTFDFILMNGVIEHVPKSIPGLRKKVIRSAYSLLRPGGYLFINDTPNRLWPTDAHSTGLPGLPWLPAGSRWAYELAISLGRHHEAPKHSPGPLGLEEVGAWGTTWWEIKDALSDTHAICLNLKRGQDAHVSYAKEPSVSRQRLERLLYVPAVKVLGVPLTAFLPSITNLVFLKP